MIWEGWDPRSSGLCWISSHKLRPIIGLKEWYCEFLHKSLVVNPPTVVNILWQVGKACLSENTLSKIVVAPKLEELTSVFQFFSQRRKQKSH